MSVPDTTRHQATSVIFESYPAIGYNYRMTDIQAAVGREQLKRLPEVIARRREMAKKYFELLRDIPGVTMPHEPAWARTNWQSFCVRLPEGSDQREIMQTMLDQGVSTRRGIMCAHREAAYDGDTWSCGKSGLKASEQAQDGAIILPLFHEMTQEHQTRVAEALALALSQKPIARR